MYRLRVLSSTHLATRKESTKSVLQEKHHVREVHHHAGLEVGLRDILGLS